MKISQRGPLASILARADMTQKEVAERSGLTRETVNRLVSGRDASNGTRVRPSVIAALAWALRLPVSELATIPHLGKLPQGPRPVFESKSERYARALAILRDRHRDEFDSILMELITR